MRGICLDDEVLGKKVLKARYSKRVNGRDTFPVASAVGVWVVDKTKESRDSFDYDNFFVIGHDRSGVRFPCPGRDPRMRTYLLRGFALAVGPPPLECPPRRPVIKAIFMDITPTCGLSPRLTVRAIGLTS